MRPLAALLSLATLPSIGAAQAADTTWFTVLLGRVPAGIEKVWTTTDGAKHFYYTYSARGRGPALTERVVLGTDGYPDTIEISGHTDLKAPVHERFTMRRAGAHWNAAWSNRAESTSVSLSRRAFYVAMDDPSMGGLLAPLLLKGGNAPVPLLPQGQARVERLRDATVSSGGKTKKLTLYATQILGLAPEMWWADESNEFFATGSVIRVIREGFEGLLPQLLKIQSAYDSARLADLAKRLSRTPSRAVAFRNANLFDAENGQMRPRTTVVVNGNRISAVGADGRVAIPAGSEIIDVAGKTLMPGLWDMHVHLFTDDAGLPHMAAGVTSVRDMASNDDETPRRTKRFDDGSLIGPRVLRAGFIDSPGPYSGAIKALVATADSARAWVERYAGLGYEQIKVNGSLDTALVPVIVAEAHKRGLRVSGHVPQGLTAAEFVRAGADELQHVYFLFLNFWRDSVDTRTTQRFTVPAQRAALLDLRSEGVQSFINLLHERGTVIDPTIGAFEVALMGRTRKLDPGSAEVADRLPALRRRSLFTRRLEVVDSLDQRYRDSFAACLRLVKAMYDGGVTIVAGTDNEPGFALHRELELYAAAGIPAPEVLRIATINAARVMKRDKELGSIAPGKLADLIVVDGHPEQRMSDIRRVTMVMKDGKFYDPAALYSAIGVKPAVVSR